MISTIKSVLDLPIGVGYYYKATYEEGEDHNIHFIRFGAHEWDTVTSSRMLAFGTAQNVANSKNVPVTISAERGNGCGIKTVFCVINPRREPKRYFIERTDTSTGKITYKQYKCIDGFSPYKFECWGFSKAGAMNIIKFLKDRDPSVKSGRYTLRIVEDLGNERRN